MSQWGPTRLKKDRYIHYRPLLASLYDRRRQSEGRSLKTFVIGFLAAFLALILGALFMWFIFGIGGPPARADLVYAFDATTAGSGPDATSSVIAIPAAEIWDMDPASLNDELRASLLDQLRFSRTWTVVLILESVGDKPAEDVKVEVEFNGMPLSVDLPQIGECTADLSADGAPSPLKVECPSLAQGESMSISVRVLVEELDEPEADRIALTLLTTQRNSEAADLVQVAKQLSCPNALLLIENIDPDSQSLEFSIAGGLVPADSTQVESVAVVHRLSVGHAENKGRETPVSTDVTYPADSVNRTTFAEEPTSPERDVVVLRGYPWRVVDTGPTNPFEPPERQVLSVSLLLPGAASSAPDPFGFEGPIPPDSFTPAETTTSAAGLFVTPQSPDRSTAEVACSG